MNKTIEVVVSNSNDMTAPIQQQDKPPSFLPSLLESVKAAYPNVTDLERYALFTQLKQEPQENSDALHDCSADFKLTQISQTTQRYLEYLEAKNSIEKRRVTEPFMPRVIASGRDRHFG